MLFGQASSGVVLMDGERMSCGWNYSLEWMHGVAVRVSCGVYC